MNVIGLILWNLEKFDEAISVYIRTQKIVKDKYPRRYAMALTNMALIYDQIGEHNKAIEQSTEAATADPSIVTESQRSEYRVGASYLR